MVSGLYAEMGEGGGRPWGIQKRGERSFKQCQGEHWKGYSEILVILVYFYPARGGKVIGDGAHIYI